MKIPDSSSLTSSVAALLLSAEGEFLVELDRFPILNWWWCEDDDDDDDDDDDGHVNVSSRPCCSVDLFPVFANGTAKIFVLFNFFVRTYVRANVH
eukprot:12911545-Ditylum_brightwellii.AAC.1